MFWGLSWHGMQAKIEQFKNGTEFDILVGCVDTRKTRRAINHWARRSRVVYWLDLGNNAASGQFVLGHPNNSANRKEKDQLPTVAELYPEIVSTKGKEDDHASCSAAEALTRQEPFINQILASRDHAGQANSESRTGENTCCR
jgi:PRTRC genetic system ThiF family protein